MGWRISFRIGPFRYTEPLRRRPRRRVYRAGWTDANGRARTCEHQHRTSTAAAECGRRYLSRDAGQAGS